MEGFLTYYYEYYFLNITGIHHVESRNIQGRVRGNVSQSCRIFQHLPRMSQALVNRRCSKGAPLHRGTKRFAVRMCLPADARRIGPKGRNGAAH